MVCLESIVPQNVLKQQILVADNDEVMVILTNNNLIFPPNSCINTLAMVFATDLLEQTYFLRMSELRKVLGICNHITF